MTNVSEELRKVASLLTDEASKEIINDVKLRILTIADNLDKNHVPLLAQQEIDDILDEIDEKENKNKDINNEEEYNILLKGVSEAIMYVLKNHHTISRIFARDCTLTNLLWILFFRANTHQDVEEYVTEWNKDYMYGEPIPFVIKDDKDINDEKLTKIFNSIPEDLLKLVGEDDYLKFAEWVIKYDKDENNVNKQLYNKLYHSIKCSAYFYRFKSSINSGFVPSAAQFYHKYQKYIDINQLGFDEMLMGKMPRNTIIENVCAASKNENMLKWLLSINGIQYDEKAMNIAKTNMKWNFVSILLFSSMGNKMRQKSEEQISKLNKMKGIVKQWFRFYKIDDNNSNEYKSMVKMVESLKTLIQKRLPISDDMLLLCMQFEMKQNNNNPLDCSLFQCLYNTLNETLRIPLNRRNWLWFKQYVFGSSLWFQKIPQKKFNNTSDRLLYHLLLEMVSKQLKAQRDYLQPHIDALESKSNDEYDSWENIKNYKEFMVSNNCEGLRQDECIDSGTNRELLPFPIRPIFSDNQLMKLNERVKEFDCYNHCDINGYLSKLILTAHSLNQIFHESMRMIFNINKEMGDNNFEDGVKYLEGPVKRLQRCQAKAETDYAHCSFPSTAKIIDFIRCCLVYKNPKDLLNGIDKFIYVVNNNNTVNTINDYEEQQVSPGPCCMLCMKSMILQMVSEIPGSGSVYELYCGKCNKPFNKVYHCKYLHAWPGYNLCVKCGEKQWKQKSCLKKILRLKNMFLENKRENNNNWDLYKYADIKMGVLMEYDGESMIVEVQFLMDFMLKGKGLGHGMYEIERHKDFIFDVNKIINIKTFDTDTTDNVDKLLANAVVRGDENELASLILNESPINFMKTYKSYEDETSHNGLIHQAVINGHRKVLKLLLDSVQTDRTDDEFRSFINMQGRDKLTALHMCETEQLPDLLKLLLSYEQLDVNVRNIVNTTVLYHAVKNCQKTGKRAQIFDMLKNDKRCDLNVIQDRKKINLFHIACLNCTDIEFIKRVWASVHYKINDITQKYKRTALSMALDNKGDGTGEGFPELIEFLLTIPDVDVNRLDKRRKQTPMDIALKKGYKLIVNLLGKHTDLDWGKGKNKFVMAISGKGDGIEMMQLVLKLCPEINMDVGNALHIAIGEYDCTDVLEFILDLPGVKVDLCDENVESGRTAWLYAISLGFQKIEHIKILFDRKDIDFNATDNDELNAMDIAMRIASDKEMVNWLKLNGFTASNKEEHEYEYEDED